MLPPLGENMEKMKTFFFTQAVRIKYTRTRRAARVSKPIFDEESRKIIEKIIARPCSSRRAWIFRGIGVLGQNRRKMTIPIISHISSIQGKFKEIIAFWLNEPRSTSTFLRRIRIFYRNIPYSYLLVPGSRTSSKIWLKMKSPSIMLRIMSQGYFGV